MTAPTWTTPDILTPHRLEDALQHLTDYFTATAYTGSYFERLGGGGDRQDIADSITTDDLVALSMLSVPVSGRAARQLLEDPSQVEQLLADIPRSANITRSHDRWLLEEGGPARDLWGALRRLPAFGPVRTSKLLARKRPHLIPVYDEVVRQQFGAQDSRGQWAAFSNMFRDAEFVDHLTRLRGAAGLSDISLLRIADVIVWREGSAR
ncbi:DUF6308 family protein [Serinicoccus hydrothermalis]|uniref:DUF6308 family protein n=1 Tax=Serinicoccus hydrothermalis TaxID=1758689 RepID=UPI000832BFCB|nr:DUF6308 family protein [Serinicoccus hydrothermalis]